MTYDLNNIKPVNDIYHALPFLIKLSVIPNN